MNLLWCKVNVNVSVSITIIRTLIHIFLSYIYIIYIYIYIYIYVKYSLADNMRQGKKSHRAVTKWCTGREWPVNCMTVISARWQSHMPFQRWRKWHIPMASYRKRSHRWAWLTIWDKVKNPTVPSQSDAPEESDLWTAWQLFPLDDDHTCHSKDGGSDTFRWPDIGRNCVVVEACSYLRVGVWR